MLKSYSKFSDNGGHGYAEHMPCISDNRNCHFDYNSAPFIFCGCSLIGSPFISPSMLRQNFSLREKPHSVRPHLSLRFTPHGFHVRDFIFQRVKLITQRIPLGGEFPLLFFSVSYRQFRPLSSSRLHSAVQLRV